jgi:apolipoprotein N-acyltransferase
VSAPTELEPNPCMDPSRLPLVSDRSAYALALLSGVLYFLAFPGIELWPLGFVALVPLIVALRGRKTRTATGVGWLSGFAMTMTGFYWLVGMLQEFSGFGTPLCVFFMAVLCAYQAGRMALCGWLYARAERRGWAPTLVFVLAFAASEVAYPLLFPWTYAATIHQLPVLLQLAELGGQILVTVVLVATNLLVAEPIVIRLTERRLRSLGGTRAWRRAATAPWRKWRRVARLAAIPAGALIYGVFRIPGVDQATRAAVPGKVGIVQADMGLKEKRQNRLEGLRRHLELTGELTARGPLDLVVWSETSVMGALEETEAAETAEQAFASRLGVATLFGAVLRREVADARGHVYFNSALLSDRTGKVCPACRYDKHYLLAFGEYLPLGEQLPVLYEWSPNSGKFTPGKSLKPLPFGEHELAVMICYEDILPGFVNDIVSQGSPDLLVNMTNDAWFGDSTEPWIHFALSKFRAIEHRRYLLRSNNSGVSGVIDPVGRVVVHGQTYRKEALTADIAWLRAKTPFERVGNAPWWLAFVLVFAAGFFDRPGFAAEQRRPPARRGRKTKTRPSPAGPKAIRTDPPNSADKPLE